MKKTIAWICLFLIAASFSGCTQKEAAPAETAEPVTTEAPAETAEPEPAEAPAPESGTIVVPDEQTVAGGSYTVYSDSEAIFSVEEGKLTLSGCSFDQTGTESGKNADGTFVLQNGGTLTMSECTLSSSADLTTAIENCAGTTEVTGSVLLLSGSNSVFFSAQDEAGLHVTNSMLSLSGPDETAFSLSDSKVTLENGSVTGIEGEEATVAQLTESALTVTGSELKGNVIARYGACAIGLTRSDWAGELTVFDEAEAVDLTLKDLSSFTGVIPDGAGCVNLSIDSISHFTLTDDSYVAVIADEDTSFSNITGNGFNLYYNGELEDNAALASGTYALNGGGYLIPLI